MGFDKVVEPGEIGVCGDEALPDKGGNLFCRQTFFQVEFTSATPTPVKVPRMSAKAIENKVNSTWKNVCLQNKFPPLSGRASSPQTPISPGSTTLSKPTNLVQLLKYDLLYLTPMDQPSASHGCSPTPLNQC